MLPMLLSTRTNSWCHWSRYLFFVIGISLLSYVAFTLLETKFYQDDQNQALEQTLLGALRVREGSPGIAGREGSLLGRIEINAIGLSAIILEGVEDGTLRHAVGHIPGTPSPGQPGNIALAAHRDTFFRGLGKIRQDDEILLTTTNGSYRYRVASTQVVEPEDTKVLDDSEDDSLTLVTCYPFNFVGSAPKRFIVRAYQLPG